MCVKLSHRNLNLGPSSPHPTNIYTCEVTTVLRVCGGIYIYCRGKGPRSYIGSCTLSEIINRFDDKQIIMKYSQTKFHK